MCVFTCKYAYVEADTHEREYTHSTCVFVFLKLTLIWESFRPNTKDFISSFKTFYHALGVFKIKIFLLKNNNFELNKKEKTRFVLVK